MIDRNSFGKKERLSSARVIGELFENGRRLNIYPLRIFWKHTDKQDPELVKIIISVPKKYFAKAVERNLIKRRIREAYRKNKNILGNVLREKRSNSIIIAFLYSGKNIIEYNELETKIISALQNLVKFI
jgi:ribonuclease P protein component